jgi:hypothetical protein
VNDAADDPGGRPHAACHAHPSADAAQAARAASRSARNNLDSSMVSLRRP